MTALAQNTHTTDGGSTANHYAHQKHLRTAHEASLQHLQQELADKLHSLKGVKKAELFEDLYDYLRQVPMDVLEEWMHNDLADVDKKTLHHVIDDFDKYQHSRLWNQTSGAEERKKIAYLPQNLKAFKAFAGGR
jgi:hypothetical protein